MRISGSLHLSAFIPWYGFGSYHFMKFGEAGLIESSRGMGTGTPVASGFVVRTKTRFGYFARSQIAFGIGLSRSSCGNASMKAYELISGGVRIKTVGGHNPR